MCPYDFEWYLEWERLRREGVKADKLNLGLKMKYSLPTVPPILRRSLPQILVILMTLILHSSPWKSPIPPIGIDSPRTPAVTRSTENREPIHSVAVAHGSVATPGLDLGAQAPVSMTIGPWTMANGELRWLEAPGDQDLFVVNGPRIVVHGPKIKVGTGFIPVRE